MKMEVFAIADDLTGALEAGAAFADASIESVVRAASSVIDACAVSVNARSRHLKAVDAAQSVATLAAQARLAGAKWLYKKTDSTLRGHIGAELAALIASSRGSSLLYVPAYPALGRTVQGGRLYVDGIPVEETSFANDPRDPVSTGSIVEIVRKACMGRVISLAANDPLPHDPMPAIYIADGTTDEHVKTRAVEAAGRPQFLAAGPAGFLREWAQRLPVARTAAKRRPVARTGLIVNGSLHPRSREQVRLFEGPWPVLQTPDERESDTSTPARDLAVEVVSRLSRDHPEALVIIGGDTAQAILDQLNIIELQPFGELLPGVAASEVSHNGRPLIVISKAGGFGPPDVLNRIREALKG